MKTEKEIKELMKHIRCSIKLDKMALEDPVYSRHKDTINRNIRSKRDSIQLLNWVLKP